MKKITALGLASVVILSGVVLLPAAFADTGTAAVTEKGLSYSYTCSGITGYSSNGWTLKTLSNGSTVCAGTNANGQYESTVPLLMLAQSPDTLGYIQPTTPAVTMPAFTVQDTGAGSGNSGTASWNVALPDFSSIMQAQPGATVTQVKFDSSGNAIAVKDSDGMWQDIATGSCSTDASGNTTGCAGVTTETTNVKYDAGGSAIAVMGTGANATWEDTALNGSCRTDANGTVTGPSSCNPDITDLSSESSDNSVRSATAQCGGSQGGSVGGIGSQLVGTLLNQVIPKGATGSEIRSLLSGNAGSAISQLAGGGTAGQITGILFNGSSIGKAVNTQISGLTNQVLGGFSGTIDKALNGMTGSITSGLSGLFGSSGGTAASSLLPDVGGVLGLGSSALGDVAGGMLGDIAGGALGSVLGGGNVPVDVKSDAGVEKRLDTANGTLNDARDHLKYIHQDQDQIVYVTCVQRPLIAAAANSFAAQFSSQVLNALLTGNGGNPYFVDSSNYQGDARDAAASWFAKNLSGLGANSRFVSGAQQYFANSYSDSSGVDLSCPMDGDIDSQACSQSFDSCGSTDAQRLRNHGIVETHAGCTQSGVNRVSTIAGFTYANNTAADQEALGQQSGGYLPKIKCLVPSGYTGPMKGCQAWQVVTPAGSVQDTANRAQNIGAEQQARASELGQLVDSLFSQLASQALTSLSGLLGTSENRNGEGSYLSQVSGGSNAASTAATTLRNSIEASMTTVASYEAVITDIITNLSNAQTALKSVQTCYLALSTSTTATLDSATAKARADTASTTIATAITPQMNTENDALTGSANVLAQLNNLDNLAQNAAATGDVDNISNAYQALVASGALHTTTDITNATNDDASSKTILDALTNDANTALNQCKSGQ